MRKNLGQLTLMILSPFSVPYILSLNCRFLSLSGHWGQFGDRMETEWRQNGDKKYQWLWQRLVRETSLMQWFSCNSAWQRARKADGLSEYVVPLHFQKYFLYYDTTQARETSMVCLVAKWTFFWILQVDVIPLCSGPSTVPCYIHSRKTVKWFSYHRLWWSSFFKTFDIAEKSIKTVIK